MNRVPDLISMPTQARGVLVRCSPKKDPKGGPGALIFTIDVSFSILDREDAATVEKYCRGALHMWLAGQEGGKGSVKDQSDYGMVKVTYTNGDTDICAGFADIVFSSVSVKGEAANLLIRFKINGLMEKAWSNLISMLDQDLSIKLEGRQTSFDFSETNEVETNGLNGTHSEVVKVTQITDGSSDSYGIISSFSDSDGPKLILCEIDGSTKIIEDDEFEVKSTMELQISEDQVDNYMSKCSANGVPPTWVDICYAVASLYKSGTITINKNNAWTVNSEIIERAIDIGNGRREMEIME